MTFRSRPVLDRKHRPRWQDELRTQQLIVVGFAVAIAIALGIFGAAAWNAYWDAHFRPVASVAGVTFDQSDLSERESILGAELVAQVTDLQQQLSGGPRDQIIQQQIDSLSGALGTIAADAAQSLVDHRALESRADEFGVDVTPDEVDAEVATRLALTERVNANLILVEALPEDAEPDSEPTDAQREAAAEEAEAARERVEGGEDFATVASEVSDDFTAQTGGALGWFTDGDTAYDEYFDALADAEEGDLVGPIETGRGAAILQLQARRDAAAEGPLSDILRGQGISRDAFREYVRGDLWDDAFRDYFETEVVVSPTAQQRVAQIFIEGVSGSPVPQERARHVLISPDPELEDQAEATDEQWEAAREEAEEVRQLLEDEDADWFAIAEERSDDTGSAARGGDLGWYDPADSGFVTEFAATVTNLEVGEISDPVRTEFGWHVIQMTGERESPQAQAADIVERLEADPDAFGEIARQESEDPDTAQEDGELGWVAPYQLNREQEEAVFALSEVGEISPIVDSDAEGITIYRLLESSDSEEIDEERLELIRQNGFDRWLQEEVRSGLDTWLDPQYQTSDTTAA